MQGVYTFSNEIGHGWKEWFHPSSAVSDFFFSKS